MAEIIPTEKRERVLIGFSIFYRNQFTPPRGAWSEESFTTQSRRDILFLIQEYGVDALLYRRAESEEVRACYDEFQAQTSCDELYPPYEAYPQVDIAKVWHQMNDFLIRCSCRNILSRITIQQRELESKGDRSGSRVLLLAAQSYAIKLHHNTKH